MIFNLIIALALVASIRAKVRDESQHGLKVPNMNVVPEGLSWKEIEDANHKVVGGTPTTAGRYPWFVWANGCGGQLIGKDIVLTAAHCNSVWTGTVYVNIFKGTQNGINQCGKAGTAGADCEKFQVSSRKMHPNYDSNKYDYDYLLVKLNGESKQEPILIVEADDNIVDDVLATTLGFGTTKVGGGGSASVTQLEASVDFKTAITCGNNYVYSSSDITSRMNCGYTEGKDACQGDSGGPFIKKGSASDGSLDIVLGVVSWGIGCGNVDAPGVYADVLDQREWIVAEACKMTDVGGTCTIGDRGPAELKDFGATPPASQLPLQLCEGDCDDDSDCAGGLECFQRTGLTPVPGCSGSGKTHYDYCIYPPELKDFGATPPASQLPLQLCEGDCDDDGDCAGGLKCFQRSGLTPVPGCSGSGKTHYDYCSYV